MRSGWIRPRIVIPALAAALALVATTVALHRSSATTKRPTVAASRVVSPVGLGVDAQLSGVGSTHGHISVAEIQARAVGTVVTEESISIDGLTRAYLLIVPAGLTAAVPLIVGLQGRNASPTQEVVRDEFIPLAQQSKAILAYPAGYGQSWDSDPGTCCGPASAANVDDVAFVKAVVAAVTGSYRISKSYLVGFSNGGKMGYTLMCAQPELFAAFAVVAAAPEGSCPSTVPRSLFVAVGRADPSLPEDGDTQAPLDVLDEVAATWRQRDLCRAAPAVTTEGKLSKTVWACSAVTTVVAVSYADVAHDWPTAAAVGTDVSGATQIWSFFAAS